MTRIYLPKKLFSTLIAFLAVAVASAQIQITFPTSRMVFQRDKSNFATLPITGIYKQNVDMIQARVVPMQGGTQTSWQTVQTNPQGGFYSGSITAQGGWYDLEIRGMLGGNVVVSTDIQRIGVGEVFAIGGQSNAQGFYNYGAPGASDDRVSCVNFTNINHQLNLPQPDFIHLDANSPVAPRGLSGWCWGRLGDLLASRYNVPIMFYNAGWFGTLIRNWRESVDGAPAVSTYIAANYPNGMPYGVMKGLLNYYASMTGMRAILWQQGEGDNLFDTPSSEYVADLQTVVNKTRQHYGRNIAWVIARASYFNAGGIDNKVINAQNTAVTTIQNLFYGPNTDPIQPNRPDGIHFQDQGLVDVANLWNGALDQNFFNNCTPTLGYYPQISATCAGNNQVNLTVSGAASTQWSNGVGSNSVTLGAGLYSAQIKDVSGNVYFVPNFEIPANTTPPTPTISVDGQLCQGSSINLISNTTNNIQWSTGTSSQQIEVSNAGTYSVTAKSIYNCSSTASINVTQSSNQPPAAPTVAASGPLTFCLGNQVTLTSSSANQYRWSNGSQSQNITVNSSGTYEARVLDAQGCRSQPTKIIVTANNLPSVPTISAQGNVEFCDGKNVILSSNYLSGNTWTTGEQLRDITVSTSGNYKVRVKDGNGCEAESNNITVKVNPLPGKPSISPEKPTTFCSGENTVLASSNAPFYSWSNGETTSRITTTNAGNYSLTVKDTKGCASVSSDAVTVRVNPLPTSPTVSSNRNPVICQNESVIFTANSQNKYQWSNGLTTQVITATDAGNYSVRAIDANNCISPFSSPIQLVVNNLPSKPTITALGSTSICEGQRVTLRTNVSSGITWSTFESSKEITVSTTAQYSLKYKDNNGCESVSDPTFVTVNSLPTSPRIVSERPTTFCQNDSTMLSIPLSAALYDFIWSTGQRSQKITVKQNSTITASVATPSTGCTSTPSDALRIVVNPNPPQPTISAAGSTTICADQSVALTANEPSATSYEWSSRINSKTINASQEGSYSARAVNQFGCFSPFSTSIFVKVNSLPQSPGIIVEGPTSLCDGGQVGMRVESLFDVSWNTNETTKRIVAKQSGNYSARIRDINGCFSLFSGTIKVDIKPIPATPILKQTGIYTLEITNPTAQGVYSWFNGGQTLTENRVFLRPRQAGKYQAQASVQYSPTLTCISKISTAIDFVQDPNSNGLGVYPNPVINGKLSVETFDDLKNATINVYSAAGRIIYTNYVVSLNQRQELDLSFLPPGNYFIEVSASGFRATKKILVSL